MNSARVARDETRRLARVAVEKRSEVMAFDGNPAVAVRRLYDRAAVAIACDSLGVAEAMLAGTVSYVTMRHQFDRPIGSFQAVKHACADMYVAIAVSRQLVRAAVHAVAGNQPDTGVAAAMAKSYACSTAVDVAGKALQLHGGYGYLNDYPLERWVRDARVHQILEGTNEIMRVIIARRLLLQGGMLDRLL